jgi:hypothetical protein
MRSFISDSPPVKRQREEAKKNEAEKEKAAERDDSAERPAVFPRVRALYQYEAEEEDELSINSGDIITVLESTHEILFLCNRGVYSRYTRNCRDL